MALSCSRTQSVPHLPLGCRHVWIERSFGANLVHNRKFVVDCVLWVAAAEAHPTGVKDKNSKNGVVNDGSETAGKLPLLPWRMGWWNEIGTVDWEASDKVTDDNLSPWLEPGTEEEREEEGGDGIVRHMISVDDEGEDDDTMTGMPKISKQGGVEEWVRKKMKKRLFPREEPWLMESMLVAQRNEFLKKKLEEAETEAAEEDSEIRKETPVQVEILINSPECTMQRMAILEDGKLVELLLEPMHSKVQVGNVYLGIVKQLLPGMSGIFVDIGGFRQALMDIAKNEFPLTFPPIHDTSVKGSLPSDPGEDAAVDEEFDLENDEEDHPDDFSDDEEIKAGNGPHDDDDEEEDYEEDEDEDAVDTEKIVGDVKYKSETTMNLFEAQDEDGILTDEPTITGRFSVPSTIKMNSSSAGPVTVDFGKKYKKWKKVEEGMLILVQCKKEPLGKKGPRMTAFPSLAGRFLLLIPLGRNIGVSRKITGPERKRLRLLAQDLQPPDFGLTVRSEAVGHEREELEKDLTRLMGTWNEILERAESAAVAMNGGMEGAVPVLLHRAMGQTLTIVRDFFTDKVHRMVVDSLQCYQEVTSYLQEVAPQLSDRVELYTGKIPLFDEFNLELEIDKFSSKRVNLPSGGYLVLEETEALVSIDVNGGTVVLGHDIARTKTILEVNLAAARQIATELRLRDIGGIIVVDFIDMDDSKYEQLVYEEMRKAIQRDRSLVSISEISEFGLMEMTRRRVRPSVTCTISDPCSYCKGAGRVEALETTLSKIERAIRRLLATRPKRVDRSDSSRKWPKIQLKVDSVMCDYLSGRNRKRIAQLSAALKVWLIMKATSDFTSGQFQVVEQSKPVTEKRRPTPARRKTRESSVGASASLLGKKKVWPSKQRRNFGN